MEHTVTEQVTGVALPCRPRVVAQGAGTITAYKEPSGVGVRVDACGYMGYSPPPQFDPLLAKLIGSSSSASSFVSAVGRTLAALAEFHLAGLPTNLGPAARHPLSPRVPRRCARTSFLTEEPEILRTGLPSPSESDALALFEQQASSVGANTGAGASSSTGPPPPVLEVDDEQRRVECPIAGSVIEVRLREGDTVAAGDPLLIISAMKMETAVTATCSGTVTAVQSLREGDNVVAGQVVALITPTEGEPQGFTPVRPREETWAGVLEEVATLQRMAHARLAPGSDDPGVVRQRRRGKLTCRERIALLLDESSFREVGSVAGFASYDEDGNAVGLHARQPRRWSGQDRRPHGHRLRR